jgi:hypothetical protein
MARKTSPFMITGPGVEGHPAESVGMGLSGASTFACRAKEPVTYYVRDARGDVHGYAERDEDGIVYVQRAER